MFVTCRACLHLEDVESCEIEHGYATCTACGESTYDDTLLLIATLISEVDFLRSEMEKIRDE